jgi:steroid delta-isomerase-like uncharacterized protein
MDLIDRYFAAWNAHDPEGVLACFTDDGTFEDPTTGGPVTGSAIAATANDLFVGFPDVSFGDIRIERGAASASAQYLMTGTNTGATPLGPPSGQVGTLPGADFFTWDPDRDLLTSVRGYWDLGGFLATMGLQMHPSPAAVPGLIDFGIGVRATKGDPTQPGCFTVTSIDVTGEPTWEVNDFVEKITTELMAQEGYLGSVFATGGGRQYTFTAWRDIEAVAGMRETVHRDAMRRFNAGTLGTRLMTSVWAPVRINPVHVSPGEGERPQREEPLAGQWL